MDKMAKTKEQQNEKAPVILVANSKGGGGKSTTSQQVLAPFILKEYGSATIKELDDENLDSEYLTRSDIKAEQIILGNESDEFASAVAETIDLNSQGLVIDVGGNRTTSIVIRELARLTTRSRVVDAICIPISDNRMGVINAEKTLQEIKDSPEGENLIKKCFIALNRVRNLKAESIDDKKLLRRFSNVAALAKKWKLDVMIVHDMDGVENLAPLGKTVIEVADMRDELIEDLNAQILKADEDGKKDLVTVLDDLQWAVNVATSDFAPQLRKSHGQLKGILKKLASK
jgi:hypothetical protein